MTGWLRGVGLHGGRPASVRFLPALPGAGLVLRRVDAGVELPVTLGRVRDRQRCTCLAEGEVEVQTVEHALAALVGLQVRDAVIEVDGPEIPILDGSALPFVQAIRASGLDRCPPARRIGGRTIVREGASVLSMEPAAAVDVSSTIEFDHPAIGVLEARWQGDPEHFAREIAPARTFAFAHELEELRGRDRIRGGSLQCAVVFDEGGVLNPEGLRFRDEPARHKLLDLIGDLALIGGAPLGRTRALRYSHRLGAMAFGQVRWEDANGALGTGDGAAGRVAAALAEVTRQR